MKNLSKKYFLIFLNNYTTYDWLSDRAVLAVNNKDVNLIIVYDPAFKMRKLYIKWINTAVEADEIVNYPSEFLNSFHVLGMPPHILKFNVGVLIIAVCNVNQPKLYNGLQSRN